MASEWRKRQALRYLDEVIAEKRRELEAARQALWLLEAEYAVAEARLGWMRYGSDSRRADED